MGMVYRIVMGGAISGVHMVFSESMGIDGRVGTSSVPLPQDVPQGEGPAEVRGVRDILRRGRHEDPPQHRTDGSRLVEPSKGVRGRGSGREESDLGRGWRVVGV